MVYVTTIGGERFVHDAREEARMVPHYLMECLDDIGSSISALAARFAPGNLGLAVGTDGAHPVGGDVYQGKVGVRREPRHAEFVHDGTGIFGPLHRPYTITKRQTNFPPNWGVDRTGRLNPAVGNVLKLTSGDGITYFRKSVTVYGQRPQPFLLEALDLAERTEVPVRVQRLAHKVSH